MVSVTAKYSNPIVYAMDMDRNDMEVVSFFKELILLGHGFLILVQYYQRSISITFLVETKT